MCFACSPSVFTDEAIEQRPQTRQDPSSFSEFLCPVSKSAGKNRKGSALPFEGFGLIEQRRRGLQRELLKAREIERGGGREIHTAHKMGRGGKETACASEWVMQRASSSSSPREQVFGLHKPCAPGPSRSFFSTVRQDIIASTTRTSCSLPVRVGAAAIADPALPARHAGAGGTGSSRGRSTIVGAVALSGPRGG